MFGILNYITLAPASAAIAAIIGYLLGSIPSGLILSRIAGLGDIREIGSGNIGATNVLRTGNKKIAALTLIADMLKGFFAVSIASIWGPWAALLAGFAAFLGHLFPIWLKFKGGKGVATYIGVIAALFWPAAISFCAIWLMTALTTRYSSLSALLGSIAAPISLAIYEQWRLVPVITAMTILLIVKHLPNIRRLLSGAETKIGAKG